MKVLIDMNLSPAWVTTLEDNGFEAAHWSSIGDIRAPDEVLLAWADTNGDLDFGAILAATGVRSPSVIQVRGRDPRPAPLTNFVIRALREYESILEQGALITVDPARLRSRILPVREQPR